tara:strand:+ start:633 stop:902 length:270 start_codon:yes stop_codon:yes gene_type:complete
MIDTDKYEGHTEGRWYVDDDGVGLIIKWGGMPHDFVDMENKANAQLMADAPLLLAEVKRLRQGIIDVMVKSGHYDTSEDWMKALNKVIE